MPTTLRDIIDELKLERDVLKNGGYGRSVRTPWREERLFRDSITCLNLGEEVRRHPCSECMLWDWVPEGHKEEDIPCHHIPLNERGESISSLEDAGSRQEAESALLVWLNETIKKLEEKLAFQEGVR